MCFFGLMRQETPNLDLDLDLDLDSKFEAFVRQMVATQRLISAIEVVNNLRMAVGFVRWLDSAEKLKAPHTNHNPNAITLTCIMNLGAMIM